MYKTHLRFLSFYFYYFKNYDVCRILKYVLCTVFVLTGYDEDNNNNNNNNNGDDPSTRRCTGVLIEIGLLIAHLGGDTRSSLYCTPRRTVVGGGVGGPEGGANRDSSGSPCIHIYTYVYVYVYVCVCFSCTHTHSDTYNNNNKII